MVVVMVNPFGLMLAQMTGTPNLGSSPSIQKHHGLRCRMV